MRNIFILPDAGQLTITLEMTDITEHDQHSTRAASNNNKQRQHEPQPGATIISISQPSTTPVRPSTVPNLHSQMDKHTTNKSATRSKSANTSSSKKNGNGYQSLNDVEDLEGEGDDEGGRVTSPLSPIDEQVLERVLYSRPTLRLGREMSMRFRAQTAIPSRRRRVYKSLPHGAKRPKTTDALNASGLCVCMHIVICCPSKKAF